VLTALLSAGALWTVGQVHPVDLGPSDISLPGVTAFAPRQVAVPTVTQAIESAIVPKMSAHSNWLTYGIGQVLRKYTRDGFLADRIAHALVHEGQKNKIDPVLLVGVVLTEDAKLQPAARSNVRATGLMQVMPFHSGKWGCPSTDLTNVEANICHGTSILADLMSRKHTLRAALQGYNGCVKGRNTPNCHTYTNKVLTFANQTSRQLQVIKRSPATKLALARPAPRQAE
jgi:hypothetical protein